MKARRGKGSVGERGTFYFVFCGACRQAGAIRQRPGRDLRHGAAGESATGGPGIDTNGVSDGVPGPVASAPSLFDVEYWRRSVDGFAEARPGPGPQYTAAPVSGMGGTGLLRRARACVPGLPRRIEHAVNEP